MTKKNLSLSISVNASANEAIKKISQVSKWWAKKVKGKSVKLNDKFTVVFGETFVDFQITEFVPNKKVVWLVTDCNLHWINNKKEWNNTEVVFEISSVKGKTKIDFTHIGLTPAAECYEDCKIGWTEHITDSLVKFIEKGKGKPQ
ncbi:SRPBCC family protein [Thermoflavifilum thermophilum]|uniref:Activator of Hsp90 ATPase homolog 1-like protein n=1 Tax=Thermoflavifilum thermophilum TaxID=1393122 RepID=A0A1I7NFC8_9BACT|nr:SRPBCC domain-containing protein [Thermoflavifilum thermophilum]SFV33372.1 Activator of Hsp90 ATPase homolog 1-like protein [Thermoflavifilum thermophilum]